MATVETVKAIVTADTAQFDRAMHGVKGGLSSLADSAKRATRLAATAIAVSAGAAAAKGITAFAGFESSMNEVFTLLPEISETAMDEMSDQVKDFGKEFGVLSGDAIPALYSALSAGVPQDNVFEFLEVAQKAAVGGVTDIETAVDGLTSVVNAYSGEASKLAGTNVTAAEASDLLFTAVKLGKTDMESLSRSVANVTPTASALGVGFGDVAASLALLTTKGVQTSVATTQMRAGLVELGKDGTKAGDAFAAVAGQSFPEFIAAGGDLAGAVDVLKTAAEESGSSVMNLFGSVEAGGGFQILADDVDGLTSNLAAMADSSGATDEAFATMDTGLSATFNKVKANAEVLLINIGEKLAPGVEAAMNFIIDHFDDFKQGAQDAFDTAIVIFGHFVTAIRPVIAKAEALGKMMKDKLQPAAEAIGEFFEELAEAFMEDGFGGAVDYVMDRLEPLADWMRRNQPIVVGVAAAVGTVLVASFVSWAISAAAAAAATIVAMAPLIALVAVVAAVAAGLVWAYQNVDWFRAAVDKMKDAAVVAFGWLKDNVPPIFDAIVEKVVWLAEKWWWLAQIWIDVHLKIIEIGWAVVKWFIELPAKIRDAVVGIFNPIKDAMTTAWEFLRDTVVTVVGIYLGLPMRIATAVIGLFDPIKDAMTTAWGWVRDKIDGIVGFYLGLGFRVKTAVFGVFDSVKTAMTNAWEWVKEKVTGVVSIFTGLKNRITTATSSVFDGVKDAFRSAINWVIDKWNSIDFGIDISVPSWVPGFGGKGFKIGDVFPDIPRLAEGGIVTAPTLAMIGEGGESEAVIPLSKLGNMGGGGSTYNITVNTGVGDAGQIGAEVVDAITAYERRNGSAWRAA